jgi:hypothetical protein
VHVILIDAPKRLLGDAPLSVVLAAYSPVLLFAAVLIVGSIWQAIFNPYKKQ